MSGLLKDAPTDAGNAYNETETEKPEYADGTIPEDGSESEEPDEADTDGESNENQTETRRPVQVGTGGSA